MLLGSRGAVGSEAFGEGGEETGRAGERRGGALDVVERTFLVPGHREAFFSFSGGAAVDEGEEEGAWDPPGVGGAGEWLGVE